MSRIGKKIIEIPKGIEVTIDNNNISVKGPKGNLQRTFVSDFEFKINDGTLVVIPPNEGKEIGALHGLTRTLIANMIEGVSKGFEKTLEINGVGYKVQLQDRSLL
ncbi:MAG: 50S ribosomal protein L6, partial [Nitrospira sp.]|nr:50S ribosomal protein L6 [Nitrospira sp.]